MRATNSHNFMRVTTVVASIATHFSDLIFYILSTFLTLHNDHIYIRIPFSKRRCNLTFFKVKRKGYVNTRMFTFHKKEKTCRQTAESTMAEGSNAWCAEQRAILQWITMKIQNSRCGACSLTPSRAKFFPILLHYATGKLKRRQILFSGGVFLFFFYFMFSYSLSSGVKIQNGYL